MNEEAAATAKENRETIIAQEEEIFDLQAEIRELKLEVREFKIEVKALKLELIRMQDQQDEILNTLNMVHEKLTQLSMRKR